MATMLKEVDAVCIGVGFTGSILARELTKAGLKVVGLERGADRSTREDFTLPSVRDDLKYAVRQELFQDTQTETVTLHTRLRKPRCLCGGSARFCLARGSAGRARTGTA